MSNKQEKPSLKCLLGIDPEKNAEMQTFGMRFLRLGSGRSRTAAGVREGTWQHLIRNARIAAHILTAAKSANAAPRKSKRCIRRNALAGLRNRTLKAAGNARLIIRTKPSNVAKIAPSQKKPIEREDKRQ